MQEKLGELNTERRAGGQPPLHMGVGIHTGLVLLADVGAPGRRDYTAIGDAVNVAARLEQATKDGDTAILISDATRARVGNEVPLRPAAPARVRGKTDPIPCWTLAAP
jgi:adenylate cyclase